MPAIAPENLFQGQQSRKFSSSYFMATATVTYPFSLAAWAFPYDVATDDKAIICFANSGNANDMGGLFLNTAGKMVAWCQDNVPNGEAPASTQSYTANKWVHAGGVFLNSTSRTAYMNGVKGATGTDPLTPTYDRVAIGTWPQSTPQKNMNGIVVLPFAWNVELTAGEFKLLYAGFPPWLLRPGNIVAGPDLRSLYDPYLQTLWVPTGTPTFGPMPLLTAPELDLTTMLVGDTSGAGTVTGSGAVTSGAATVAGAGVEIITGTGSVTAGAATVAGAGTETITGSGATAAGAAAVSGAGTEVIVGSGAVAAGAASMSGAGDETLGGSGAVTAVAAAVAGAGEEIITGSGAIAAGSATVTGAGTETIGGTGAATAGAGAAAGTGEEILTGAGTATAGTAQTTGTGNEVITGVGAVVAGPATIAGQGTSSGAKSAFASIVFKSPIFVCRRAA